MENRRSFLKKISAGTTALLILKSGLIAEAKSSVSLFINESNNFPGYGKGPFVIGILCSSNPLLLEDKIKIIRKKLHYNCELRYRSTDKFKEPFAVELINLFFNEPTLTFYGRVITGNLNPTDQNHIKNKERIYLLNLSKAVIDSIHQAGSIKLLTEDRFEENKAQVISFLTENIHIKKDIKLINSHDYNLYQLGNLITGSVYGDEYGIKNETKAKLLNHLKRKLDVSKLSDLYNLKKNQKFFLKRVNI